ncbi:MAG: hypothetical protein ACRCTF_00065 [Bacteroidales bacterium]
MDYYCVNINVQSTGEHEVHTNSCRFLPDFSFREGLGVFSNCSDAIEKAKEYYSNVDGCSYCCPACHKK